MNRINLVLFIVTLLCSVLTYAQEFITQSVPHRIILNLTEEPTTSIFITWRTVNKLEHPKVQFAESTQWKNFKEKKSSINAVSERFWSDSNSTVYHYSARINNLNPNTKYVYRVGSDIQWSEWNQFTTAESEKNPFQFVYFGDPQNSIKEHCSRVFREAYKTAPDASLWLFAGDLVGETEDSLWGDFFTAAGFVFRVTPSILVPGNHDHEKIFIDGKDKRLESIASIWRPHFTLPQNGITGLEETSYYVDYQGVRFVMLNSQTMLNEQVNWLDKLLSNNPNNWTIITLHHPLYSVGNERDNKNTREAFLKVFDKYNVDLVLQGHDHTYARTYKLKNGVPVDELESGTVYIVSVSGPKSYSVNPLNEGLMAKMGNEVQLFQVISVEGEKLSVDAFTVNGLLYDSFELVK